MKVLISNGKLPRLKYVEHKLYESCIFKKPKKVSFSKVERELKKENLKLVHTNVLGLSILASLRGSNYYVTFIDDSTRKLWVLFSKE